MRTYCIAQGTQCSGVNGMGRKSKEEGIYVYVRLIHLNVQQKLTQKHCKATILQLRKQKDKKTY